MQRCQSALGSAANSKFCVGSEGTDITTLRDGIDFEDDEGGERHADSSIGCHDALVDIETSLGTTNPYSLSRFLRYRGLVGTTLTPAAHGQPWLVDEMRHD
jgi:hypothetical protein